MNVPYACQAMSQRQDSTVSGLGAIHCRREVNWKWAEWVRAHHFYDHINDWIKNNIKIDSGKGIRTPKIRTRSLFFRNAPKDRILIKIARRIPVDGDKKLRTTIGPKGPPPDTVVSLFFVPCRNNHARSLTPTNTQSALAKLLQYQERREQENRQRSVPIFITVPYYLILTLRLFSCTYVNVGIISKTAVITNTTTTFAGIRLWLTTTKERLPCLTGENTRIYS